MIASASKKNDEHDIIFFAPVTVAVAVAEEGVIHPCRCLLTSTPSHRKRDGFFSGWTYLPRQNPGRISKKKLGTLPS